MSSPEDDNPISKTNLGLKTHTHTIFMGVSTVATHTCTSTIYILCSVWVLGWWEKRADITRYKTITETWRTLSSPCNPCKTHVPVKVKNGYTSEVNGNSSNPMRRQYFFSFLKIRKILAVNWLKACIIQPQKCIHLGTLTLTKCRKIEFSFYRIQGCS